MNDLKKNPISKNYINRYNNDSSNNNSNNNSFIQNTKKEKSVIIEQKSQKEARSLSQKKSDKIVINKIGIDKIEKSANTTNLIPVYKTFLYLISLADTKRPKRRCQNSKN